MGTRPIAHIGCNVLACSAGIGSWLLGRMAGCFEHRAFACTVVCFLLVHWNQGLAAICAEVLGLQFDQSSR